MTRRILHIDASPRDGRSRSRPVAERYIASLASRVPGLAVEQLDLWTADLPELGDGMIESRYALLHGLPVDPDHAAAWDRIRGVVDHFLGFDHYVISTPMWNFGLPYRLKHYIDVISQPGMTFSNDAQGNVVGLAAGRGATVIAACAMPITDDGPLAPYDYQLAYLRQWLGFIGIADVQGYRVAPTFGTPEQVDAVMAAALAEVEQAPVPFATA